MARIPQSGQQKNHHGTNGAKPRRKTAGAAVEKFQSLIDEAPNSPRDKMAPGDGDGGSDSDSEQPRQRSGQLAAESHAEPLAPAVHLPSPDQILASLSSTSVSAAAETPPLPNDMNSVVQQVAEEVQVHDVNGSREVRISLKNSVLAETEVRIVQEGGQLKVEFLSDRPESLQRIQSHTSSLQAVLNERFPDRNFVVTAETNTQSDQQQDRRSNGHVFDLLPNED